MTTTAVFRAILGIAVVLVAISLLGLRFLVRRMDDWADRMIRSLFGSPEELLRRLQEQEVLRAQRDSGKPAACDGAAPPVERPHWATNGEEPAHSAGPETRSDYQLTR